MLYVCENFKIKTAGPQVAYYINLNPVLPYVGAGYIWKSVKMGDSSDTVTVTNLIFKGGLACMVGQYLSLFGEVSYSKDKIKEKGSDAVDGNWLAFTAGAKAFF